MKKFVTLLLCSIVLLVSFPMTARADFGPKPSVQIDFKGLGDELCYGTLLSDRESTGPSSAWNGNESDARHNENEYYSWAELDYETWKAFVDYKDADGFYFLQEGWRVDETKELNWTYYPPYTFKILLYYPESGNYVVSETYERYAFDSYFTVDLEEMKISEGTETSVMVAKESYNYTWEIISLVVRIIATILIEIAIAYVFWYKNKMQIRFIMIVNLITQVILNVALNVVNYRSGFLAFCLAYVGYELIVLLIEVLIYQKALPRWDAKKRWRYLPALYALIANVASCVIGFLIVKWIPGIG